MNKKYTILIFLELLDELRIINLISFDSLIGFNFGKRQTGEIVDDVTLPPWCENNARLFILIHRQVSYLKAFIDFVL